MNGTQRESAVSETISTVLAVALVVILAALVAAYVFGMIPSMPRTYTVAVTSTLVDNDNVVLVYHGGPDQKILESMTITWPSGAVTQVPAPKVGDSYPGTNPAAGFTSGPDHIVVTGYFDNGAYQVIYETFV